MRLALQRVLDPLFGWIPDVNRFPARRVVAVGTVASLLVHFLLLVAFLIVASVFPDREDRPPTAEKESLEVTVVPMPQNMPKPIVLRPPERRFLTSEGLKPGEKPKEAQFETDRDMTEASEVPPSGENDLPGQQGEDAPMVRDFVDQDIMMKAERFVARNDSTPATQPQPEEPMPQAATVAPLYAPQPVNKAALAEAEKAQPQDRLPEPAKPTKATPPPVTMLRDDQIAFATPTPQPKADAPPPVPNQRQAEQVRPSKNQYARLATPQPLSGPSLAETYKRELRKTRSESRITNRGLSGVNAINTPAGRWRKQMYGALSQNWQNFLKMHPEYYMISTVRVSFKISKEGGLPTEVRLEAESDRSLAAQAALRAVRETPFTPPPPDLFEGLPEDKLEDSISFTIY